MNTTITATSWHGDYECLMPITYEFGDTFHTTDDTLQDLNGQPFTLLRVFDRVDENHDAECLPMFEVRIGDRTIEAFADELEQEPRP